MIYYFIKYHKILNCQFIPLLFFISSHILVSQGQTKNIKLEQCVDKSDEVDKKVQDALFNSGDFCMKQPYLKILFYNMQLNKHLKYFKRAMLFSNCCEIVGNLYHVGVFSLRFW